MSPTRLRAIEQLESARPSREALEALTMEAMRLLQAPRSQLTLVTADRQFTLAITGVDKDGRAFTNGLQTPIEESICSRIVESNSPLSIEDARDFPVVCNMACVTSDGIRAYLGHPISSWEGEPLGSFCVIDYEPREWTTYEKIILASLASTANTILLTAVMHMVL